jgi:hypothetical protein
VAEKGQPTNRAAQARCWEAFFAAWTDSITGPTGPMLGICGYRWDPYRPGGDDDMGYGILGKPAGAIVRGGLTDIRRRSRR